MFLNTICSIMRDRRRTDRPYRLLKKCERRTLCHASVCGLLMLLSPLQAFGELSWDPPWEVHVNGQRLSITTFSSPLAPDRVAQELVRADSSFQRYLLAEGRILLSGIVSGQHRLADIQVAASGSHGYVSTLFFTGDQAGEGATYAGLSNTKSAQDTRRTFRFPSSVSVDIMHAGQFGGADVHAQKSRESILFSTDDAHPDMGVLVSLPAQ